LPFWRLRPPHPRPEPCCPIEPGKLADLVVVDRNLLKIDPREILQMNVDLTMVDGHIVFERR
jgi:predicted amidohydrolase YtcJ